jgi:hypothetical protein
VGRSDASLAKYCWGTTPLLPRATEQFTLDGMNRGCADWIILIVVVVATDIVVAVAATAFVVAYAIVSAAN